MSSDACQAWRPVLAADAIGAATPEEHAGLLAHLDGCADCRAEAEELGTVARILPLASVDAVAGAPAPPRGLGDRIVDAIRAERAAARRRTWRTRARIGVAVLAGALVGILGTSLVLRDGGASTEREGAPVTFAVAPAGAAVKATVVSHTWGTGIWFDADGLRPGNYAAWVERGDGTRVAAGTFHPGPDGKVHSYFTSGADARSAAAIGVSDERGTTVLRGTTSS